MVSLLRSLLVWRLPAWRPYGTTKAPSKSDVVAAIPCRTGPKTFRQNRMLVGAEHRVLRSSVRSGMLVAPDTWRGRSSVRSDTQLDIKQKWGYSARTPLR